MSELSNELELIDDGSGTELQAYQSKCRCSNLDPEDEPNTSDVFYVFWDPRHNPPHLHIQCYDCHQMYCPYNACVPPPTAEVIGY